MTPRTTARTGLIVVVLLVAVALLVPGRFGSGPTPDEGAGGPATTTTAVGGAVDPLPTTADAPSDVPGAEPAPDADTSRPGGGAPVDPRVEQALAEEGRTPVIVQLDVATEGSPEERAGAVAAAADEVLAALPEGSYTAVKPTGSVPALALSVDAAGLDALRTSGPVARVAQDGINHPTSMGSTASIGATAAWPLGLDGEGSTVAVLDTGVASAHPYLKDGSVSKVVAEACFSTSSTSSSATCPAGQVSNGQSVQIGPGAAAPCTTSSSCKHGTHVAGIAAGGSGLTSLASGTFQASGVAPGADIVAVQVFSTFRPTATCVSNQSCSVIAYDSDIIAALDWLYTNRASFPGLAAVNLSLGGGQYAPGTCDTPNVSTKQAIDALRSVGVVTVIAAGNDSARGTISSPGCISTAVAVGWVDDANLTVSSKGNLSSDVDLLAPGSSVWSSVPPSGMGYLSGTSMATPAVAGAVALMRQVDPGMGVPDLVAALRSTGSPITVSGVPDVTSFPYLQVQAATALSLGSRALPPRSAQATAGLRSATVTWAPPSPAPDPGVTSYTATASPGGQSCTSTSPVTTCTITGLTAGMPVRITVVANNAAGSGARALGGSVVPFDVPGAPTAVSAFGEDGSAWVTWAPPSSDGALPISAYTVTASPGGATCTAAAAVGCRVPALSNGTSYAFTVTATNAAGSGPSSGASPAVVPGPSALVPLLPARLADTRAGSTTVDGVAQGGGALPSGGTIGVKVTGRGGVPASGVGAVALNVTATGPTSGGYLTVHPSGSPVPWTSNLNFVAGQTVPNMVIARVGPDGSVAITGVGGPVDVIVDVMGWFPSGPSFSPLVPARLADTRAGSTTVDGLGQGGGAVASGATRKVKVAGRGGVPATGVGAVALNVTATGPTSGGYLTVYPSGSPVPWASNLNFAPGQTVPNMVIAQVGPDGSVSITSAGGPVDVIVDVMGWFPAGNSYASLVPARLADTRSGPGLSTVDGQGLGGGAVWSVAPRSVKVTGRGGVPPNGVGAVALNVTATGPTSGGYLTVYPSGSSVPYASNLNFAAGQTVPNMVIARVGPDGKVSIAVAGGPVDVIVDVMGWFPA